MFGIDRSFVFVSPNVVPKQKPKIGKPNCLDFWFPKV